MPSHLYSFSYAQRRDWSRLCSPRQEILDYLRDVARDHGVDRLVVLNAAVTSCIWDDDTHRWTVATTDGRSFDGDAIVLATGQLHKPAFPRLEDATSFQGHVFHSARWDHGYDLRGKRVAVLGTGASAAQFIPEIAPNVTRLVVFQRTANWFLPRKNRPYPAGIRAAIRHIPGLPAYRRRFMFFYGELLGQHRMCREPRPDNTAPWRRTFGHGTHRRWCSSGGRVMPGEVSDAAGSPGGPTLQEAAENDLAERLQPRPLRCAGTGCIQVLDHVVPALQVRRRRCQMQPVTGLPESRDCPGCRRHPLSQGKSAVGLASPHGLVDGLHRGDAGAEDTGFARAVGPVADRSGSGDLEQVVCPTRTAAARRRAGGVEQQGPEHPDLIDVWAGKHPGVEPLCCPYGDAFGFGVVALPDQHPREVAQRGGLVQVGPCGEPGDLKSPVRGVCSQVGQLQPAGEAGSEPVGRGEETGGAGRLVT